MSFITQEIIAKATIHRDKAKIKEQLKKLLKEAGLPNGLLPLDDAEECGHVNETGFMWIKQKTNTDHKFEKIDSRVAYRTEITAYVEPTKMKKITGVKAKGRLISTTIVEIAVPFMNADKVTLKSSTGLSKTYPAEAFMAEDLNDAKVEKIEIVGSGFVGARVKEV